MHYFLIPISNPVSSFTQKSASKALIQQLTQHRITPFHLSQSNKLITGCFMLPESGVDDVMEIIRFKMI